MTSSILLGTAEEHKIVCAAAKGCDFRHAYDGIIYVHRKIEDLRLQIHSHARHFADIAGIITQVEFDDLTDKFPDNPRAVVALKEFSIILPGLLYRNNVVSFDNLKPAMLLSDYLLELKKIK